jgi:hypothetical protein
VPDAPGSGAACEHAPGNAEALTPSRVTLRADLATKERMPRPPLCSQLPLAFSFAICFGTFAGDGAVAQSAPVDPNDLRSKSIDVRLQAIDAIGASERKDAEQLLTPLLKDKDWEIQERTAAALGKVAAAGAMKALVDLAIEGDVRRIREAAALALPKIDAAAGAAAL